MEEYYYQIREFLPINFFTPENEEYIEYLKDAYLSNINSETYQFSFIAFHMLYMSFLFKTMWTLKKIEHSGVKQQIINCFKGINQNQTAAEKSYENLNDPFGLSIVKEKTLVKGVGLLGFHPNIINDFSNMVDKRDYCAHASGFIQYKGTKVERFIQDELEYIGKIHKASEKPLVNLFTNFLNDYWNPDKGYGLADNTIKEFIKDKLISIKDLELLVSHDWDKQLGLSTSNRVVRKKILVLVLMDVAAYYDVEIKQSDFHSISEKLFSGIEQAKDIDIDELSGQINDDLYKIKENESNPFHNDFLFLEKELERIKP